MFSKFEFDLLRLFYLQWKTLESVCLISMFEFFLKKTNLLTIINILAFFLSDLLINSFVYIKKQ